MKKQKGTKEAVFQSFIISIFVLIVFLGILFLYVIPETSKINDEKIILQESAQRYFELKEKGFTYEDFIAAKLSFPGIKDLNKYESNIIKDFKKDQFELYFYNSGGGNYKGFLEKNKAEVAKKKEILEKSGAGNSIASVLPYYSSNGSFSDTAMTDFSFVNHIENTLYRFRLNSTEPIGVGELEPIDDRVSSGSNGKGVNNEQGSVLDGKIYKGTFPLRLVGKKKNIFDFIYYIQNVGKIEMSGGSVNVIKPNKDDFILVDGDKKVVNNFKNLGIYFRDLPKEVRGDFYNNLIMDFDSISFIDYPDGSDLPTPDNQTLVGLIMEKQGDEKYEIDVKINFYIKGLPQYRINESIEKMFQNYERIQKISGELSQYIRGNQSKLISEEQLNAINNISKFDRYVISIEKDVLKLKKSYAKKEGLDKIYSSTLGLNQGFEILSTQILKDAQTLSKTIYNKYNVNK